MGCLTGVLSIAINSITDPSLFPFAIIAGVLGLVIGIMARKGMFIKFSRFVISAIIVSVIAVALSVTISLYFLVNLILAEILL